jgi:hypothetical protein
MKEIQLGESTPVPELAKRTLTAPARIIEVGFHRLGLLLTVVDNLAFDTAKAIAEDFGYTVHRI